MLLRLHLVTNGLERSTKLINLITQLTRFFYALTALLNGFRCFVGHATDAAIARARIEKYQQNRSLLTGLLYAKSAGFLEVLKRL
jgi:hypothetical protein